MKLEKYFHYTLYGHKLKLLVVPFVTDESDIKSFNLSPSLENNMLNSSDFFLCGKFGAE